MKQGTRTIIVGVAIASLSLFMLGCEREIAHTKETKIKDDGTVKTEEKTVTESDGTTTVTEEKSTTKPN